VVIAGLLSQLDWTTHGSLGVLGKMVLLAGIAFLGLSLQFQLLQMVLNDGVVCCFAVSCFCLLDFGSNYGLEGQITM
jgi:uncharacterized membrane protein YadS